MEQAAFRYNYAKTLWMKMFLARPDFPNNRSQVLINFEEALEIIRAADALTQGIEKIVYLVGWQGLGHDDCYPEMHKVNDFLRRSCDADGHESLLWLIREAKKYHTIVSVHGNLADEYEENESHPEFTAAGAVAMHADGTPAVIERFNDRNAYKVSYKQFWESGLFQKYWEKFCETVPVRELGTVHLDNFCIAESFSPRTDVREQNEARCAILDYIRAQGIDVTSEYTYRELALRADSPDHPIHKFYRANGCTAEAGSWRDAPIHTLGRIPATWWTSNMTPEECISIPPSLYSGRLTDPALFAVFYGSMHGENIWLSCGKNPADWVPPFIRAFCLEQLPYMYLNRYARLRIETDAEDNSAGRYTAYFSEGVVSCGKNRSIEKNGISLKIGGDVILPLTDDNRIFAAYSENGRTGMWNMPDASFRTARISKITPEGNRFLTTAELENGALPLSLSAGQAVVIEADNI